MTQYLTDQLLPHHRPPLPPTSIRPAPLSFAWDEDRAPRPPASPGRCRMRGRLQRQLLALGGYGGLLHGHGQLHLRVHRRRGHLRHRRHSHVQLCGFPGELACFLLGSRERPPLGFAAPHTCLDTFFGFTCFRPGGIWSPKDGSHGDPKDPFCCLQSYDTTGAFQRSA